MGVDERKHFKAGRAKFETRFAEMASRDHGARERMSSWTIPRKNGMNWEAG